MGFESPFDLPIALSKKSNRAIPLKAQLFDSNNNLVTADTLAGLEPPVVAVSFSSTSTAAVDQTSLLVPVGQSSTGNQFSFDASTGSWQFNLGTTPFTAAGTYTVSVQSGNASQYQVGNSCSAACQVTYHSNVSFCRQVYDPSICGTDTGCQQQVLQEQASCLTSATNNYNSCTAVCPTTAHCSGQFVRP